MTKVDESSRILVHPMDMPRPNTRPPEIDLEPESHNIAAHARLAAMLERAIRDAVPLGFVERHHIREARKWFLCDSDIPFGFLWTCEALMICPEFVKHSIFQLKKSQRSLRHYRMDR